MFSRTIRHILGAPNPKQGSGITVVGTGGGNAPNGADFSFSPPTGMRRGDLMILFTGGNVNPPEIGSPGWIIRGIVDLGSGVLGRIYSKRVDHIEGPIYIIGSANVNDTGCAVVCAFRGVDLFFPFEASASGTGNSTNPDPSAITTITDSAMVVVVALGKVNDASITVPSGYSNIVSTNSADVFSTTISMASKIVTPPGAENPASWTNWSTSIWGCITFALKPAFY